MSESEGRVYLYLCILAYLYMAREPGKTEQKKAPRPLKRICGQIVIHVFFSSFGVFCSFTDKRAANGGGMEELCTRAMKWNWQAEP